MTNERMIIALLRRVSTDAASYGAMLESRDRSTLSPEECQQVTVLCVTISCHGLYRLPLR
jgi:hypothetical protein